MSKIVAIVGRPNVGKSTLFNRLNGQRKAIVDNESGVTRDRHYGTCEWQGREFIVIDTGGYVSGSEDVFETAINDQVKIAMQEADILLFMVDVSTDITSLDEEIAKLLRKSKKPVFVVVNKVDNFERQSEAAQFYKFGFDTLFNISSVSGSGTGELLDEIVENLGPEEEKKQEEELPKIAIVGRPNVGKSSLVNALLGVERNIVTDIAGTTRDSIHTKYNAYGKEFLLIDTAGIRKKSKVSENIEFYSVMRSIKALEECDVCILVLDATQGLESQDLNLFHLADKNGKGIIILVNKWDLVEKDHKSSEEYTKKIKEKIAPFTDVPIIYVSALTKQRIFKAVEKTLEIYDSLTNRIPTSQLNEDILPIIDATPPPAVKGKYVKIKYVTQLKTKAVTIIFFCNLPQYINDSYKRFLENKIRQLYNFEGVPMKLFFRKK